MSRSRGIRWARRNRSLGVALVLLCLTACASVPIDDAIGVLDAGAVPTPRNVEGSVFLPVPHLRQERDLCVPTAAAIMMAFFDDPHSPRELKVLSRGTAYDPTLPFSDFTTTWWKDLVVSVEQLGYSWRVEVFPASSRGFTTGLESIKASLSAGRPVLVDVAVYGSHTFVVVGFEEHAKQVFVRDPNLASPGVRSLTFDEFKSLWHGRSYGLNGRPALFTKPAAQHP